MKRRYLFGACSNRPEQQTSDGHVLKRRRQRGNTVGVANHALDARALELPYPPQIARGAADGVPRAPYFTPQFDSAAAASDDQAARQARGREALPVCVFLRALVLSA